MLESYPFSQCKTASDKELDSILGIKKSAWVMEPKIDGWRIQMHVTPTGLMSWTRTGHDATGKMEDAELKLLEFAIEYDLEFILDGEAVYMNQDLRPDFNMTARILGSGVDVARNKALDLPGFLTYYVFDILMLDGYNFRPMPWEIRTVTRQTFADRLRTPYVQWVPYTTPSVEGHEENIRMFGEGSILKDRNAPYAGRRHKSWLKWKNNPDADVVIMDFTLGEGKYFNQIGAVEFGQYKDGVLTSRGFCSGMTDEMRARMSARPSRYIGCVIQIRHYGKTINDVFRHPQWGHFRDDKAPEECTWD